MLIKIKIFIYSIYYIGLGILLKGEFLALKSVRKGRMQKCKICAHYNEPFCKECGCIMPLKTKLIRATCPKEYW